MEGEKQSTAVTLSNSSNGNTQHSNITCMCQPVCRAFRLIWFRALDSLPIVSALLLTSCHPVLVNKSLRASIPLYVELVGWCLAHS